MSRSSLLGSSLGNGSSYGEWQSPYWGYEPVSQFLFQRLHPLPLGRSGRNLALEKARTLYRRPPDQEDDDTFQGPQGEFFGLGGQSGQHGQPDSEGLGPYDGPTPGLGSLSAVESGRSRPGKVELPPVLKWST